MRLIVSKESLQRGDVQVRAREFVRALEQLGWYVDRQKRHVIMRLPDRSGSIPIPMHSGRTLKKGTLHNIIKKAGITEEQLRRLL